MTTFLRPALTPAPLLSLPALVPGCSAAVRAVEMRISRDAIERTLKQQLFAGPNGRYYLKGSPHPPASPTPRTRKLAFVQDRIVVRVKPTPGSEKPSAEPAWACPSRFPPRSRWRPTPKAKPSASATHASTRVSDQKELNFLLNPFLSRQVPSSMKVNAADLLRKALEGSTASSGYKVTLDRLKIHSIVIDGDTLVVDVDGDLSVK